MSVNRRLFLLAFAVATCSTSGSFAQDAALEPGSIPCTCRFQGTDVPVGQTMCLDLPSGDVLAVCDRVLNNTAWKPVQQGCQAPGLS